MTHVSKNKVAEDIFAKIRRDLRHAVSPSLAKGPQILEVLLTPAERVMLSKRLAIIVLLQKGLTYYRISKLLKVSVATIIRIDRLRLAGRYKVIQSTIEKGAITTLESIELFLSLGLRSRLGPRHNARLKDLREKRRR